MSLRATIVAIIVAGYCLVSLVSAGCDACSAAPEGGWGPPDFSDDPTWGASLEDLVDYFGGSSTGGGTGGGDAGSSQDTPGGSSSSGTDGASPGSGSSSSHGGGSVEDGLVWRLKGDDLSGKGLYEESAGAYRKALDYDPYALRSWTGLGKVLLELGQPGEAATAFQKAIKLDPAEATLYEHLGDALSAAGSHEEAVASYQRALAINPTITGVAEKIRSAKDALAGVPAEPGAATLPEPDQTQPAPPQTTGAREMVEVEELPLPTQSVFPGMAAVLAILAGAVFLAGRKP